VLMVASLHNVMQLQVLLKKLCLKFVYNSFTICFVTVNAFQSMVVSLVSLMGKSLKEAQNALSSS